MTMAETIVCFSRIGLYTAMIDVIVEIRRVDDSVHGIAMAKFINK